MVASGKPIAVQHHVSTLVSVGADVELHCKVDAYPKPLVAWSKNSVPIMMRWWISVNANGSLVILRSRKSDAGVYICAASNEMGEDMASVQLVVRGEQLSSCP